MQIPPPQANEINLVVFRFESKTAAMTPQDTPTFDCFLQSKREAIMKAICFVRFSMARIFPSLPDIQTQSTLMPQEEVALAENVKPAFKCRTEASLMWIGSTC